MNQEGFLAITNALSRAGIHATIEPEPAPGEHADFMVIVTDPEKAPPHGVMNVLCRAGLVQGSRPVDEAPGLPLLDDRTLLPGMITLRDLNTPPQLAGPFHWQKPAPRT
jgi:hypothetical protein